MSRPHVAAAVQHPPITRVNIIMWVCYFSQGCATVVYASATLSLSLYYALLIWSNGFFIDVYGFLSTKYLKRGGGVQKGTAQGV